jgi:rubrerythrin
MDLEMQLGRLMFRALVSHAEGRAFVLSLMVAAEEGDEAGVFDEMARRAGDPELERLIRRHQDDERRHAALYRACLSRNGLEMLPIPDDLLIIRQVTREAGHVFASDGAPESARRRDVMETYALLLAIERRGVERFPVIGAEFRRLGDHETADTFDQVTEDERRHTKYCEAIGRRFSADEGEWGRAVARYRDVERRAFRRTGAATFAYIVRGGLFWPGRLGRFIVQRCIPRTPGTSSSVSTS